MTNLNSFTKKININASAQKVYNAWTSQNEIEKWFLRRSEFTKADGVLRSRDEQVAAGDTYLWMWFGYEDDVFEKNTITEANGKDKLKFVFSANCNVTVSIKEENGISILELIQDNFPESEEEKLDYYIGCITGWTFYLSNLKSYLEGGIDLRNKGKRISHAANA